MGEDLHFAPRRVLAKTLMNMSVEEYSPVEVFAYAPQEILVEKYKAMLTRVLWRDYFDAYYLWMDKGKYPNDLRENIVEKGVRDLRRKFLRKRFERVRSNLETHENALNRIKIGMEREKGMILRYPPMENFERFVDAVIEQIIPIENKVGEKYIEERCRELVSKYTVSTRDGYRVNLRKMNDEDYRFYEEHQEEFNRICDAEHGVERGEEDELEL